MLLQCWNIISFRAVWKFLCFPESVRDMYTAISNSTFVHVITTCEIKGFVCQNTGSSLVLKCKRKPAFLGLGSFHPDTEFKNSSDELNPLEDRTEFLIVFLRIGLYTTKFRCINVEKQLKCLNIYI